jgi:hypothetical protein
VAFEADRRGFTGTIPSFGVDLAVVAGLAGLADLAGLAVLADFAAFLGFAAFAGFTAFAALLEGLVFAELAVFFTISGEVSDFTNYLDLHCGVEFCFEASDSN